MGTQNQGRDQGGFQNQNPGQNRDRDRGGQDEGGRKSARENEDNMNKGGRSDQDEGGMPEDREETRQDQNR